MDRKEIEGIVISSDNVEACYPFKYEGKGVSMNDYYNSGHWTTRNKLVNKYHDKILNIIGEDLDGEFFDHGFGLFIFYNSRHDTDNVMGFGKIFVDLLKNKLKIIKDDDKKNYKISCICPDLNLPHNTFEFLLVKYGDK